MGLQSYIFVPVHNFLLILIQSTRPPPVPYSIRGRNRNIQMGGVEGVIQTERRGKINRKQRQTETDRRRKPATERAQESVWQTV